MATDTPRDRLAAALRAWLRYDINDEAANLELADEIIVAAHAKDNAWQAQAATAAIADGYKAERDAAREELDAVRLAYAEDMRRVTEESDAMRAVVEAARSWRQAKLGPTLTWLAEAVDALDRLKTSAPEHPPRVTPEDYEPIVDALNAAERADAALQRLKTSTPPEGSGAAVVSKSTGEQSTSYSDVISPQPSGAGGFTKWRERGDFRCEWPGCDEPSSSGGVDNPLTCSKHHQEPSGVIASERSHLIHGEFQSDKYPTCPRGKVPLSCKDPTAQDLLWEYARRRRKVDNEFANDLEEALLIAGYTEPLGPVAWTKAIPTVIAPQPQPFGAIAEGADPIAAGVTSYCQHEPTPDAPVSVRGCNHSHLEWCHRCGALKEHNVWRVPAVVNDLGSAEKQGASLESRLREAERDLTLTKAALVDSKVEACNLAGERDSYIESGRETIEVNHKIAAERDAALERVGVLRSELEHVLSDTERETDAEHTRWQERIADTITRHGLDPFDASGNESGDPLDWTDDQVSHALAEVIEERDAALTRVGVVPYCRHEPSPTNPVSVRGCEHMHIEWCKRCGAFKDGRAGWQSPARRVGR